MNRRIAKLTIALSCFLAVLLLDPAPLYSQPSPSSATEVTKDTINAAFDRILETQGLSDDIKAAVETFRQRAAEQIDLADASAAVAATLDAQTAEAPARLAAIKAELAAPVSDVPPVVPADATLADLEQTAAQAEAELAAAQKEVADLDAEFARRADRRNVVPGLLVAQQKTLPDIDRDLALPSPPDEAEAIAAARRAFLQAQRRAATAAILALEKEIPTYLSRSELLNARRDLAAGNLARADKLARTWRDIVAERRKQETQRAARDAEQARKAAALAHPEVRKLAEDNADLASRRNDLAAKIDLANREFDQVTKTLASVNDSMASVQAKVQAAGLTRAVSVFLRKQLADLPNTRSHRAALAARQAEIADAALQLLELQDERSALTDLPRNVADIMKLVGPSISDEDRKDIQDTVESLFSTRRQYVQSLLADLDIYFAKLVDVDISEQQLIAKAVEYETFINKNILWFRSAAPFAISDLPHAVEAASWITHFHSWGLLGTAFLHDVLSDAILYCAALLGFTGLFFLRRRLLTALHNISSLTTRAYTDRFRHTLAAFAITVVLASFWPLVIVFLSMRLATAGEDVEFIKAVSTALRATGGIFFASEILRQTCRADGLADAHFQWRSAGISMLSRNITRLLLVLLPCIFIFSMLDYQQQNDAWKDSLGRIALVLGLLSAALFAQRVLRPRGTLMHDVLLRNPAGWLSRLRYLWYPGAFGVPLVLALAALFGYVYTAIQLTGRLAYTFSLALAVLYANAATLRWLYVAHRRLALDQALKRRAAEAEARHAAQASDVMALEDLQDPAVDIFNISAQTRQFARSLIAVGLIFGLWLVWSDMVPALGGLDDPKLPSTNITLASLALSLLVVLMTVIAAKNIPGLLEITILQRLPLDHGVRYAISTVARYLLTVVGVVIAFGAIGIGWSQVQWLIAAMTVGLGFGLQEIFGNFVSGLIILLERPMRIGDTVTVGTITGTVTRIQIRSTTIRDWDRKELIVPNKEFITGQLINWTLSDPILRIVIRVGIAYGSDTRLAAMLLLQAATDNPSVLTDPAPKAVFARFGESSLDFELRVFIPSIDYYFQVSNDLHMAVDDIFRKNHVEIAFPQQDIHVRSVDSAAPPFTPADVIQHPPGKRSTPDMPDGSERPKS